MSRPHVENLNLVRQLDAGEVPPALSKAEREHWETITGLRSFSETDRAAVELLSRTLARKEAAFKAFKRKMTQSGSRGQTVLSPHYIVYQHETAVALTLLDKLGLNSQARARQGASRADEKSLDEELAEHIASGDAISALPR